MQLVNGNILLSASDLTGFLECAHLTRLELEAVRGERSRPAETDPATEVVARRGDEHERTHLDRLRAQGFRVVEMTDVRLEGAGGRTPGVLRDAPDVVYQAPLAEGRWRGIADFLERVDRPSDLGTFSYEVADTKLARRTRPYFLLQLSLYSELLESIQGVAPERVHVVLGSGERDTVPLSEVAAYYRRVKRDLEQALDADVPGTYPEPVSHCAVCRWRGICDARRVDDDHLSLVAGIRRHQRERLVAAGIRAVAELAALPAGRSVPGMSSHTLDTLRRQAALQVHQRMTGELRYELLAPEEGRGLARLPPPSRGDLFFDMEGDPFVDGGLEYLFGVGCLDGGEWTFRAFWAHDRHEERRAFEGLMDLVTDRRRAHPDLHVYHYAPYEPTALKRLAGLHGTREEELDDLLRGEVLVDLYAAVRQGLRISQPSYSLKKVETFYMSGREGGVTDAAGSIVAYERYLAGGDHADLEEIERYNEEDCRSTMLLRDWLLERRTEAEGSFGTRIAWTPPAPYEPSETSIATRTETGRLAADLAERGERLLAELLYYHRREELPEWWWYFARLEMDEEELIDDHESIGGLEEDPAIPPEADKRSLVHTLRFPPQEHRLKPGETIDPATGESPGTIVSIDDDTGLLRLRRGPSVGKRPMPRALIPPKPLQTTEQRGALRRLAGSILQGDGRYAALLGVLAGTPPRVTGSAAAAALARGVAGTPEIEEVARSLDGSHLVIQGPPGAGKTYTGAHVLVSLIEQGRRVGVAATSHKAIHNLLVEVEKAAAARGVTFRGLKKSTDQDESTVFTGTLITSEPSNAAFESLDPGVRLIAGTAWLFSRGGLDGALDHLVIDEAGQVSLADALAMGTAARNLILLGDPQQLPQVTQGAHPPGAGASVLEHLLGEHATIPPGRGIFLERTWRMHPALCRVVSELSYEGRLRSETTCEARRVACVGLPLHGVRAVWVEHRGNSQQSPEEAEAVAAEVKRLAGATYVDESGQRDLNATDILVVAPYNAQVRRLRQVLPSDVQVGTVDRFQGQQAPVVIFSMATSSGEELPRNLEFLFSRNRLNVAISRAFALAILVASPHLLRIRCRTVDQMRLVNALCRLAELAGENAPPAAAGGPSGQLSLLSAWSS
jgi:uncharacterized protein